MRIHTIFSFKLGIRRVRGKEWASDRVGRENMSYHENLIDLMGTALNIQNLFLSNSPSFDIREENDANELKKEI